MKTFTIMSFESHPCKISRVPFEYALQFNDQAIKNHSQSIQRLNERGGLDPVEFYAVAHGISWREAQKTVGPTGAIAWLEEQFLPSIPGGQSPLDGLRWALDRILYAHQSYPDSIGPITLSEVKRLAKQFNLELKLDTSVSRPEMHTQKGN